MKINKFILKKRKYPSKSSRITNLESLWYKFMRYLRALRLSLTITLKQHNATLPKAKGEEGGRKWDGWMASLIQWTWTWANFRIVRDKAWCAAVHGITKSKAWLSNWTTTNTTVIKRLLLPKTHMVFLKQLLSAQHAFRCYAKIVLKLISFYPSNILRKWVLFSPFYRKENEGLWGGDGKRESWDGGLERETRGICTATL